MLGGGRSVGETSAAASREVVIISHTDMAAVGSFWLVH